LGGCAAFSAAFTALSISFSNRFDSFSASFSNRFASLAGSRAAAFSVLMRSFCGVHLGSTNDCPLLTVFHCSRDGAPAYQRTSRIRFGEYGSKTNTVHFFMFLLYKWKPNSSRNTMTFSAVQQLIMLSSFNRGGNQTMLKAMDEKLTRMKAGNSHSAITTEGYRVS
jgi:hypothetical protein